MTYFILNRAYFLPINTHNMIGKLLHKFEFRYETNNIFSFITNSHYILGNIIGCKIGKFQMYFMHFQNSKKLISISMIFVLVYVRFQMHQEFVNLISIAKVMLKTVKKYNYFKTVKKKRKRKTKKTKQKRKKNRKKKKKEKEKEEKPNSYSQCGKVFLQKKLLIVLKKNKHS